ncbi:MAG: CocE/NonD family hydrolase [Bryobacteraceae bacterium]|nr:CocE/NonD family hydrolase [Bryobacteraceae bacterium]
MRFTILLLLASPLFAADAVPLRIDRYQPARMRDGVTLYADVYRPSAPGRYPTIVIRTPYSTQREGSGIHGKLRDLAGEGYAVVNQDVRGRYESEGRWDPFRHEALDGYDTIEWAAKQPWSNGKVCTQGGSYLGHVQWAAATQAPPSLVCAFPAVASTNIYANWITQGGAFRLSFNYGWGVVRMPNRIMLPQWWHTGKEATPDITYEQILPHLPLNSGDEAGAHYAVKHYRDWLAHPSYDAYWKSISDEERFDKVKVPVHTAGGWFDIFLPGTINGYTGLKAKGGQARMIIGAWGHGPSQKYGDLDFGPDNNVHLADVEKRFFDHYLKGADNGIDREPPVRLFYMGVNRWKSEADWPIPGTQYTPWYLAANGRLTPTKPAAGTTVYTYDPQNPVPTTGGNNCCGTPTAAGPVNQRALEARGDIVGFTSDPLEKALAIAGPVKMHLNASTDGPDTDWMVKLIDVYPNGDAFPMAEGILRARFRRGLDKPELLKPNQTYEFVIDLIGTAVVFQPGHRIRVDVTSSNFPQFDRNPNTGEALGSATKLRVAKQTLQLSLSHILLPVVPLP